MFSFRLLFDDFVSSMSISSDCSPSVWLGFRFFALTFLTMIFFGGDCGRERFLFVVELSDIGEIEFVDCFRWFVDRLRFVSDRRTRRVGVVIGSICINLSVDDCRAVNGVLVCGLEQRKWFVTETLSWFQVFLLENEIITQMIGFLFRTLWFRRRRNAFDDQLIFDIDVFFSRFDFQIRRIESF